MTKTKKIEKIKEITDFLISKGYTVDRFGNYSKVKSNGRKYRYKFQTNSIRYEVQYQVQDYDGKMKNEWTRLRSAFIKDIGFNHENKMTGFK